ncbi:DUF4303 domain-containing protein [Novipirellula aureliae]|uniref:DUF4303 domain-containing protein n=1 Tax=Novipirellula aureliae TaxID=2527966 RepID=UPI0018CF5115|nr:DUF4303 domain-containing protein [Novipirellula aureliae]
MDWKEVEATFLREAEQAVERWAKKNRRHHAYAFAFHESYRELDGQIAFPFLGVNSIEFLEDDQGTDDVKLEWNSADWNWENILAVQPIDKLGKLVCDEATKSTQAHWYRTEKRFVAMVVRVARALRKKFAKHANVTPDFVVYFDDEDGGLELVKKCVPAKLYNKHFFEYEEDELSGLSENAKFEEYLSNPWLYEDELVAMGKQAIDPLRNILQDPERGWSAAAVLGDLGVKDSTVLERLRKEVKSVRKQGAAELCAMTLGLWDDLDFLFKLVKSKKTQTVAVYGILVRLKSRAGRQPEPIPLDYEPVERLLALRTSAISRFIRKELEPGSSFIEIKPADVDEAIRGLTSQSVVIRQHAVCVLGERGLGKAVGKRVLPELAKRLYDKVPNVRRLALLAISDWKAAAKPYHAEMKKLQKEDPDPDVRFWANYVFE